MSVTLDMSSIIESLKVEEGFRAKAYHCTEGHLTIGYGRNIDKSGLGITEEEAEYMLKNDVIRTIDEVRQRWAWFDELNKEARGVMVELCFQLGAPRLAGFKKMLAALEAGDNDTAASELRDSKFARQVPARSERLANRLMA